MVYAIVLAGGVGRRMGSDRPKQFMLLAGRPVLVHALAAFEEARSVDRVVLVAAADTVAYCQKEIVEAFGLQKVVAVVAGGKERQDSVAAGLKVVEGDVEVVAVHDGARPLVRADEIDAVVVAARETGAAVLGTPVADTVKEVVEGQVVQTLDRTRVWRV
ncbi:MAG: 2-C-methyl-D-erythritol 4-phosphate cytidylyltransferase, partial [bacterium]|nr:2-C-methyl-D-erythritol 4-phosphate cytidylyltransferase [bacterium]